MSQGQTLFTQDGQHVFDEVVAILIADLDRGVHAVPHLRGKVETAHGEGAQRLGFGGHHRKAPHDLRRKCSWTAEDVAAISVFQQCNGVPVTRVEDQAGGFELGFAGLENRVARRLS